MSRIPKNIKLKGKKVPENSGVYFMRGIHGRILYIGKAGNLRRRVESYFARPADNRIEKMVKEIRRIDYEETNNALEALILESLLIKKYKPPYNVMQKDDKSFLYVEITRDEFPVVHLVRGKSTPKGVRYGPFTSGSQLREALKLLRRIFPYSVHHPEKVGKYSRPCFDAEVGLCPGTCVGRISKSEYKKTIRNLKYFFEGKRTRLMKTLEREMKSASKKQEFEKAEKIKRQIFGLKHINDVAIIEDGGIKNLESETKNFRIEGYDISNLPAGKAGIGGESAVGSMVVFTDGRPDKKEYRKFKIWGEGSNPARRSSKNAGGDTAMLREVLSRRLQHNEWQMPDLILIDGGKGQVSAVKRTLRDFNLHIPVVGIAKGATRKKSEFICIIPKDINPDTLIAVRDEAHRFAQSYHKKVRGRRFLDYKYT